MKNPDDNSWPLEVVLHYGNCRVRDDTWRSDVMGPFDLGLPAPKDESQPTFGVRSANHARSEIERFCRLLERITRLSELNSAEVRGVVDEITAEAQLEFDGFTFDTDTGRLDARWKTTGAEFKEMLFAYLALCLMDVPFYWFSRCRECAKFFINRTRRRPVYCSPECRSAYTARRYRSRNQERYRERQRKLMQARRDRQNDGGR